MHHLKNYTALYFALLLAFGCCIFYFTAKNHTDQITSGAFAILSCLFLTIWLGQRKKDF